MKVIKLKFFFAILISISSFFLLQKCFNLFFCNFVLPLCSKFLAFIFSFEKMEFLLGNISFLFVLKRLILYVFLVLFIFRLKLFFINLMIILILKIKFISLSNKDKKTKIDIWFNTSISK